ncbi:MAG: hypothetical protein LBJ95_02230 [Oscillospiraceae bacterium]|nr:hypothetical protein [Oscillospiraceae bacterium]
MKIANYAKKLISLAFAASLASTALTHINAAGYNEGSVKFKVTDTDIVLKVQSERPASTAYQWMLTIDVYWHITHTLSLPSKSPKVVFIPARPDCGSTRLHTSIDRGLNCGTNYTYTCQNDKALTGEVHVARFGPQGEEAYVQWQLTLVPTAGNSQLMLAEPNLSNGVGVYLGKFYTRFT